MLGKDAHRVVATLKDVSSSQPLLGCGTCADRQICGGLHLQDTGALVVSCMSHCTCDDPSTCDLVCPTNAQTFTRRFHEVDGWDLNNIPSTRDVPMPALPSWVPLYQGNLSGRRPIAEEGVVALPLTLALRGTGPATHARTDKELSRSYGVRPQGGWVLSGTEDDPAVERIWGLPDINRIARQLARSGAIFATTPNFSLVNDSPRHDNLHAMKRIAWTWHHMTQGGLCTALHLNGRTDHDFVRWAEFVRARPQVKAVAFEFLTGTATKASAQLYLQRLARFSQACGRRLPIVIRGQAALSDQLLEHFSQVIKLDSTPYMRSTKRRKAVVRSNGTLSHVAVPTTSPRQLRSMLEHNVKVHRARAEGNLKPERESPQGVLDLRFMPTQLDADNEPTQMSLFSDERIGI